MTVHNEAKYGEIAKTVLMPGDPMRAKYIAEHFLEDYKLVNKVRGMYAYTGEYEGKLKYSPSTDFLVYNGSYWEESRSKAQAISQELTTRQLEEAEIGIKKLTDVMFKNGAWDILASVGPKKAVALFNEEQARVYKEYEDVVAYRKYAIKRRDSKYIFASLKEVSPMVEIKQDKLDSDEFLLNTPTATYDLRFGVDKKHEHSAAG